MWMYRCGSHDNEVSEMLSCSVEHALRTANQGPLVLNSGMSLADSEHSVICENK